ncbi:MAG: hypothetical protein V1878_01390 [bacterium]
MARLQDQVSLLIQAINRGCVSMAELRGKLGDDHQDLFVIP